MNFEPRNDTAMAARDESYYWKEIVGAAIWITLLVWLFRADGLEKSHEWLERIGFPPDAETAAPRGDIPESRPN